MKMPCRALSLPLLMRDHVRGRTYLERTMLAAVDAICVQQDLTRSQVFRRSLMEYLKRQNAIATDVNQSEPRQQWPADLFQALPKSGVTDIGFSSRSLLTFKCGKVPSLIVQSASGLLRRRGG